jgi:hypothetical protein
MRVKALCSILSVVAVVVFLGASAEAQLPKRGTYSGLFGWHFTGTFVEVEKEHSIWNGHEEGPFFNDAGSGFLHLGVVICTDTGEANRGEIVLANGYCTVTDKDGDKAFLEWRCKGAPRCTGTFDWKAGSGKYLGIKGHNSFHGGVIGQAATGPVGYSFWKGEWELP